MEYYSSGVAKIETIFLTSHALCCSFGAGVVAPETGITLSSGMDDFSWENFPNYFNLPGSPANAIAPQKRPLSSMSPSILVDRNGNVRLVVGAAGGTKIPTAVVNVSKSSISLLFEKSVVCILYH